MQPLGCTRQGPPPACNLSEGGIAVFRDRNPNHRANGHMPTHLVIGSAATISIFFIERHRIQAACSEAAEKQSREGHPGLAAFMIPPTAGSRVACGRARPARRSCAGPPVWMPTSNGTAQPLPLDSACRRAPQWQRGGLMSILVLAGWRLHGQIRQRAHGRQRLKELNEVAVGIGDDEAVVRRVESAAGRRQTTRCCRKRSAAAAMSATLKPSLTKPWRLISLAVSGSARRRGRELRACISARWRKVVPC